MSALLLELRAALGVDQAGGRIGKPACRDSDWPASRCASTKIAQPDPSRRSALLSRDGDGNEFGGRGGVEIGPAKTRGALERAILVEDDAALDQGGPRQEVGEALGAAAVLGEVHHGKNLTRQGAAG